MRGIWFLRILIRIGKSTYPLTLLPSYPLTLLSSYPPSIYPLTLLHSYHNTLVLLVGLWQGEGEISVRFVANPCVWWWCFRLNVHLASDGTVRHVDYQ